MFDQRDHRIGPRLGVIDGEIVSVDAKKVPQSLKSSALIALFEGVRPSDAGHQDDAKHEDVFLAKAEKVPRSRQRAFEQATVAQKVWLSDHFRLETVVLDYGIDREPVRLIWQGRLGSSGTSP